MPPKINNNQPVIPGSDGVNDSKNVRKGKRNQKKFGSKPSNKKEKKEEKQNIDGDQGQKKQSLVDNKYTDIKLPAYRCCTKDQAPTDAHSVTIDCFGLCCQIVEMMAVKLFDKKNLAERKKECYAAMSAAIAVLENIVLGCRYSDIPSEVVDMFPRVRVILRKDYLDIVHACSIPKGRVFIDRGNKSVGQLCRFLEVLDPENVLLENQWRPHMGAICDFITKEKFDSIIITPSDKCDPQLEQFVNSHQGEKVKADSILAPIRAKILSLNALFMDDDNYDLYVPVICEQSEVCYMQNNNGDLHLVTFTPITNEDLLSRLKVNAYCVRFYVKFVKIYKETKVLVDANKVDEDALSGGYKPIFEKYGMMSFRRRMEDEEEESVIVEANEPVPKNPASNRAVIGAWKSDSTARKQLVQWGVVTKKSSMPEKLEAIAVRTDGVLWLKIGGRMVYSALVSDDFTGTVSQQPYVDRVSEEQNVQWSTAYIITQADKVETWVNALPALPKGW